ncbi:flap endonuclease 1-like [Eucalyptus grandis]|uniref:flap endonuclease 1-like n=1 Tax=Eucalyptus grandis TaxID=71139 RepID=UPI00192EA0DC|nr:flap endonuclease 1-like [Eucalyptus grandis]
MLYFCYDSYVFDGKPPDLKKQELAKRFSKRADASEELAVAIAVYASLSLSLSLLRTRARTCAFNHPETQSTKMLSELCIYYLQSQNKEDIEKFNKRTAKVTQQHNEDCKRLLRLIGVPVVEATSEAEAQCAALCKARKVYAIASEDMDSLTFGAPIFLGHLMDPSSRKVPVMEFEISKMNLDMDQSIDLCILSGCDYCESIQGIGGLTALKLIHQHGSIENILEKINKQRYQIPDNWPYSEAQLLFKEPIISMEEQPEIKWTAPNEEGLISNLVNENGFNIDHQ